MAVSERTSVVQVIGLHHAGLPCNDLDRAVEFYTRVLGFEHLRSNKSPDDRGHFLGNATPPEFQVDDPAAQADYDEYVASFQRQYPGETPASNFARMRAGNFELVLFKRLKPTDAPKQTEVGIFHTSLHVSKADLDRLIELKEQGDSGINFHNGPVLRWPHGRAMYLLDTEGNYIELESEEDLPAAFGAAH